MRLWFPIQLKWQLQAAKKSGIYGHLATAAQRYAVPLSYVLAIGSRETGLVNKRGDYRGGLYHGYGVLQGDIQHDYVVYQVRSKRWQAYPEELIGFCIREVLLPNLVWARRLPEHLDEWGVQKVAASAYNCGPENARAGMLAGDSDRHTTGADYGWDVMARMKAFAELLKQ